MKINKQFISVLLSVLICVFVFGIIVYATTTVGDDVTIGGVLTVSKAAISNPISPTLVGTYIAASAIDSVYVSGRYAYVSDYLLGMKIIDVSNPSAPILVGSYHPAGSGVAEDIYVSGKYAYLADGPAGLHIIDISDPANPTLSGTYDTSISAFKVYVSGRYAYVACTTSGLQIIDISTPTLPTLAGTYDTTGSADDVFVSGKYAYIADDASGLQIVDISTPASPTLVGTYDTTGLAYGIYVSGKYAYVADESSGLQIIDIQGAEINGLNAGNINTNDITITENADIANNLYVRNGINVGQGGIMIDGRLSIGDISHFKNAVGIGTTTPSTELSIVGTASISQDLWASGSFQFGGGETTATVSYSRLGSTATGHSLSNANDLMIDGSLEIDGTAYFDGLVSASSSGIRLDEGVMITTGIASPGGDCGISGSLFIDKVNAELYMCGIDSVWSVK